MENTVIIVKVWIFDSVVLSGAWHSSFLPRSWVMADTPAGGHGVPKLYSTVESTESKNHMPDIKNGNIKV